LQKEAAEEEEEEEEEEVEEAGLTLEVNVFTVHL